MANKDKIIIFKIGTTSITKDANEGINRPVVNQLATAAAQLKQEGYSVAIISSGAMGLGIAKLGRDYVDKKVTEVTGCDETIMCFKQALTSVGQVELMNTYENILKNYNIHAGQVLVTHKGLDDTERNETIQLTIQRMFELGLVPIINANDTVSSRELAYSDNDSLAARISLLVGAQKLIILSDVDGLYNADPNKDSSAELIKEVKTVDDKILALAGESSTQAGMGGMKSKIKAAKTCLENGIEVEIVNTKHLEKIFEATTPKTVFKK